MDMSHNLYFASIVKRMINQCRLQFNMSNPKSDIEWKIKEAKVTPVSRPTQVKTPPRGRSCDALQMKPGPGEYKVLLPSSVVGDGRFSIAKVCHQSSVTFDLATI